MEAGLNHGRGKEYFSSPKCPDWFWDPPTSYSFGTRVLSQVYSSWRVKLSTHLHLLLRLRISGAILPPPPPPPPYALMESTGKTI